MKMTEVGEMAPDFALYDYNRKLRHRSEFLVKVHRTILAFYRGAFTGVCSKEMCADDPGIFPDLDAVKKAL